MLRARATRPPRAEGEAEVVPGIASAIEHARGGGRTLEGDLRGRMESALATDLTGVRVHTDTQAHTLSQAVNAVAFTTGKDIFFQRGAYDPAVPRGEASGPRARLMLPSRTEPRLVEDLLWGVPTTGTSVADRVASEVTASSAVSKASQAKAVDHGSLQRQCACAINATAAGECDGRREAREKTSLQRFSHLSVQLIERKVVCPPGVSEEDGTGCYEVSKRGPNKSDLGRSGLSGPDLARSDLARPDSCRPDLDGDDRYERKLPSRRTGR